MLNFFRRAHAAARSAVRQPVASVGSWAARFEPIPAPEVLEGNSEVDWALWDDTVPIAQGTPDLLAEAASIAPLPPRH